MGPLGKVSQTCGNVPILTGHVLPHTYQNAYQICSFFPLWKHWSRMLSHNSNSLQCTYSCWPDACPGSWSQPKTMSDSDKLTSQQVQMLDGWRKEDTPTAKRLPVKADVPEFFCWVVSKHNALALEVAPHDLMLIVFIIYCRSGNTPAKVAETTSNRQCKSSWRTSHSSLTTRVDSPNFYLMPQMNASWQLIQQR